VRQRRKREERGFRRKTDHGGEERCTEEREFEGREEDKEWKIDSLLEEKWKQHMRGTVNEKEERERERERKIQKVKIWSPGWRRAE
jgi:hypothetical protein